MSTVPEWNRDRVLSAEELAAMREVHEEYKGGCTGHDEPTPYPCDAVELLAEVDRLTARAEAAEAKVARAEALVRPVARPGGSTNWPQVTAYQLRAALADPEQP